jgi:hypothetical protein
MRLVHAPTVLVGVVLAAALGCGDSGPKMAEVSGVVTINGKPYGKAVVSFQPIGTKENPNPGRGSSAYTDENGRFVLKTDDGRNGAVVGKHRVRIMTKGNDVVGYDPALGSPDGDPNAPAAGKGKEVDPIPPEWNALSTQECDVPAGGRNDANFDIKNPRYKN